MVQPQSRSFSFSSSITCCAIREGRNEDSEHFWQQKVVTQFQPHNNDHLRVQERIVQFFWQRPQSRSFETKSANLGLGKV